MRGFGRFLILTIALGGVCASRQSSPAAGARTITIAGTLTRADYEHLLEREFEVSSGTKSLKITLAYTGAGRRTVVDLGLKGPSGFRGWSGGGPQSIVVGPTFSSYGYLPGQIEPGRWAVILGVPNIRDGSADTYSITVQQLDHEEPSFPVIRQMPGWFTGDFHSHSGHSDGRAQLPDGTATKLPPHRVFDAARQAGLDFIALTDHNTTSHWTEVERLQAYYRNLLLLHAREVTTYNGHLNAFGEREFTDFRVTMDRPLQMILERLASTGAFVSINHPALPDDETCMGCGWSSGTGSGIFDHINGIEIVNGAGGDRAEGPLSGWPFWVRMLNAGYRITALGGSDEHTADVSTDGSVGNPATVVYADALSEPALLDGLRKGRAYVRVRGPKGPELRFEASSQNTTWQMGDSIPRTARAVRLSATVTGAEGQQLQWIRNGEVASTSRINAAQSVSFVVTPASGDWYSIVIRDDRGPTLFGNAIYVER